MLLGALNRSARILSAQRFQAKERITRPGNRCVIARKCLAPGSRRQYFADRWGGCYGRKTQKAHFSGDSLAGSAAGHLRAGSRLRESSFAAGRVAESLASRQACEAEEITQGRSNSSLLEVSS